MHKNNISDENNLNENPSFDENLEIGEIEEVSSEEIIEEIPANNNESEGEQQQQQSEPVNKTISEKIANLEQALKNDYAKALKGDNNYAESNTILENDFKNLTNEEKEQLAIKSVVGTLQTEKDEKGYPVFSNYVKFDLDKETNEIKISPISSYAVFSLLNESLKERNATNPKNFNSTEDFIEKNNLSLDDFSDVELKLLEDLYAIKNAQTHNLTETKVEEKTDVKTELATTNKEPNTETVQEDGTIFGTNANALDLSNIKPAENAIVSDITPTKTEENTSTKKETTLETVVNDTLDAVAGETKKPKTEETKTEENKKDENKKDENKKDDGKGNGGGGGKGTAVKAALTGSLALLALILAITGFGGVLLLLLVIAAAIGSTQLELGGGSKSAPEGNSKDDTTKDNNNKDKTTTTEKTATTENTTENTNNSTENNTDLPDINSNKPEQIQETTETTETPALEGQETKLLESNEGVEQNIPEDNKTMGTTEKPALEENNTPLLESNNLETTNNNIPQLPVAPVEKQDDGMER